MRKATFLLISSLTTEHFQWFYLKQNALDKQNCFVSKLKKKNKKNLLTHFGVASVASFHQRLYRLFATTFIKIYNIINSVT